MLLIRNRSKQIIVGPMEPIQNAQHATIKALDRRYRVKGHEGGQSDAGKLAVTPTNRTSFHLRGTYLTMPINSTRRDKRSCNCSTERLVLRKKTADTSWRRRKSSRISCARRKIGLRSWKRRSMLIRNEPNALNNGCTAFARRLKIDFSRQDDGRHSMQRAGVLRA